mgnify:CR=1 FL=1
MADILTALNRSMAVIEFTLDGKILTANPNFLAVVGYGAEELKGQHHRMFVAGQEAAGSEYRQFWQRLAQGQADAGQYKRVGKGGREIWLQASYNPILDASGRPYKVVKYATDVSAEVLREPEIVSDRLAPTVLLSDAPTLTLRLAPTVLL